MQISRLFEIIYILMKKSVTAKELAARFEVSPRTVYRDIETLCQAGIPIYMTRGRGGGISLLDNYVLDKSLLSQEEKNDILSALQGFKAANPDADGILRKISALFGMNNISWIDVDFSNWNCCQQDKFDVLKHAVIGNKVVCFCYYNSAGQKSDRIAEPLQLWFKDKTWYLKAYCRNKKDIRLFKLTRIKELEATNETFDRELPAELPDVSAMPDALITLKLMIDESQAYRVYDEFDEHEIDKQPDGRFAVTVTYPQGDWVYGFILSYGETAEVVEPEYVREYIKTRLHKTLDKYI